MFDIKEQYFRSFINLFDKHISVKTALTSPFPQTHSLSDLRLLGTGPGRFLCAGIFDAFLPFLFLPLSPP